MRLTQLLAEGGVGSTLVVKIHGIGERAGGDGDTSDGYSGRSLHGRDSESGVAVTEDHVSKLPEGDRSAAEWLVAAGAFPPTITMSGTPRPTGQELEEAFVKITFQDEREDPNEDPLYPLWTWKSRCYHSSPSIPCSSSYPASAPRSDPFVYV